MRHVLLKDMFKAIVTPKAVLMIVMALILMLLAASPLWSANSADVTTTVTFQNISVAVSDGVVAYGTLQASGVQDTTDTTNGVGVDNSQTATNDGNVVEDINIRGANTDDWVLGDPVAADVYRHRFCTSSCDSASPTWTALTTINGTLANDLAPTSGNQIFDLEIQVPSSSNIFTQQQAVVTVQAVAG